MLDIPLATVFVIAAALCFTLAAFKVTVLGHAIGWYGLAAACLCGAWLAGGDVFK